MNPRNQAKSASSSGGAHSDSICKDIGTENAVAMTLSGWLAVMDSAPTLNATPSMIIWNQSILNQKIKQDLKNWEEELILIHLQVTIAIGGSLD